MDKLRVLKGYLGPYLKKPCENVRIRLKSNSVDQQILIHVPLVQFNDVITFLLVKDGRKSYKIFSPYEIIDVYLGHNELFPSLSSINYKNLIITIYDSEMPNKRRYDLSRQLCMVRRSKGLNTVVLCHSMNVEVLSTFTALGYKYVDCLSTGSVKDDDSEEELF